MQVLLRQVSNFPCDNRNSLMKQLELNSSFAFSVPKDETEYVKISSKLPINEPAEILSLVGRSLVLIRKTDGQRSYYGALSMVQNTDCEMVIVSEILTALIKYKLES